MSPIIDGYISVGASKAAIDKSISSINKPVYQVMFLVLIVSFTVFLFIARYVGRPIRSLTRTALELSKSNYAVKIEKSADLSELGELNNAFIVLRDALSSAQTKNDEFNRELERQIATRTFDLEQTRLNLLEAQEIALIGNYEIDFETGNWKASELIFEIFQIPHDYLLTNNSWEKILNGSNLSIVKDLFNNSIKYGISFQKDLLVEVTEHNHYWISISGRPVRNADARFTRILGTIQDITKRKEIENDVSRLSMVAKKTSNSVIITDVQRKILWANESTLRLTGYAMEEIIGRSPKMFQYEKTDPAIIQAISHKLANREEVQTEIQNRGKNGNEYWLDLNIVPLFNEDNTHIGFMAVETDITERIKFEEDLKRSEENYRSILENSSEMIHTIDNDGRLIWANRSWREKLGVMNRDVEGLLLTDFLASQTLSEFQRVIPELMEGKNITNLDCQFISANGNYLTLEGRAIPLIHDGIVVGSQAYLHDITQIRKAEQDLKQLLDLTQTQNIRLKNFAHIVSHNLRSHSSNLKGLLTLLELEFPEFKDNEYLENFQTAVQNLMEVIRHLSEVAQIQTNESSDWDRLDLGIIVDKTVASVLGLAKGAKVDVQNEIKEPLWVKGDAGYLNSIILNLLTNAIKYKSNNRDAFVRIRAQKNADKWVVSVEDNGLGIDLERQGRKMFGMYKTFHKHPDARGVGLFLVKNQIEAMGGKIEVQSEVDKGTVFSVFLPAIEENS
ncbi:MAG: PAS domain S-box protein [Bacteroidia bacterium]